ncbi:MAG: guanylate kinase [Candidatus Moranbacteria bacterium RIFOXYA12_FULL_35_19]|nr:MAG: Guanylate kinase [Candidatus Moranbacteria bacterium GW2011_GWF2_35_39]OGI32102.1 MAG: guanylate kinase [Candidatus Moranbacteria bacterium RIFOXYB12_FULL_35_8]OGI33344.1 MAG: guanylate kinase [Candidatus Moranbacteria bacterium RIFOXYC12_FULL_36_13]OGI36306.1 MAG: guanylate kinase [Candidatus Moranbacteria bacterium RIFOXYA12_FULL_35_19]
MSNIFIISGPSGAGEDSVIEGLKKYFEIERIITTTTRQMRSGESQGHPYYFISKEEFITKRDKGEFVEWAEQYNGNFYGVSKEEIERVKNSGKIGTWKIEWKGVITAKKIYPEIKAIFITVPDLKILEDRIRRRDGVSDEYIKERMEYTKEWMKHEDIYDYKVVNEEGKLDETVQKVAEIIKENLHI